MKPQGRKTLSFKSKEDRHPRNGYINWWEDIVNLSKKRDRREAKKEIKCQMMTHSKEPEINN